MTECTHCRKRYDDSVRFCPVDGFAVAAVEKAREPWVGRLLMGQFQIESVCGHGATGTVYRAVQAGMERAVAVKVLRADLLKDPDVVRRFVREARAGAKVSHQNIATVHLVGQTDDGVPFLVMEYVEGLALASILAVGKPLPLPRIVHIGTQIASALSEAHSQGIVHRDLKPENILLTERRGETDVVKVVDFGIAKMVAHAAPGEDPISRMGTVFGTPHYIAPEQASGQPVDGRADIYSLGCILYQMATGHVPFAGQAGLQVLLSQVRDPVPDPRQLNPRISEPLAELTLSMLAKAPAERPQSAEAVGKSLRQIPLGRGAEPRAVAAPVPAPVRAAVPVVSSETPEPEPEPDQDQDHAAFFGPPGSPTHPRSGRDGSRRAAPSGSPRGRSSGRRPSEVERTPRPPSRVREVDLDEREASDSSEDPPSDRHERAPVRSLRRHDRPRPRVEPPVPPEPFLRRHWVPLAGVGGAVTVGLLVGILYAQWTNHAPPPPAPPPVAVLPPPAPPPRYSGRSSTPLVKSTTPPTAAKKPEASEPRLPEVVLPAAAPLTGPRVVPQLPPVLTGAPIGPAPAVVLPAPPAPAPVVAPAPAPAPPPAIAAPTPPPAAITPPAPPAVPSSPPATTPAADKPAPPAEKTDKPTPPAEKPAPPEKADKPAADEPEEPSSDPYHRLN